MVRGPLKRVTSHESRVTSHGSRLPSLKEVLLALFSRNKNAQFEEIEEYRALLEPPKQYEEAFNLKTIIGAIFVSVIMVPGNIYLNLMVGGGIGAAAEWVTIILFLELSKRSFTTLKRQEIYLLLDRKSVV